MCSQNCLQSDYRAIQGHTIALNVRQIDELGHERDYWRDLFTRLCEQVGQAPADAILKLSPQ